jgi:hypothetical protein
MDMPCNCTECNQVVELNDMVKHPDDCNKLICENCHYRIEEENNSGKTTDGSGNTISWVHDPDDGLMTFFLDSVEITCWVTETEPEVTFLDFMNTWNMAQAAVITDEFGDGWYDGFLEAQKLAEDEDSGLSELKEDEVREMSEHAESKHAELKSDMLIDHAMNKSLKKVAMNSLSAGELYLWAAEPQKDNLKLVRLDKTSDGLIEIDGEQFWPFEDDLIGCVYGPIKLNNCEEI